MTLEDVRQDTRPLMTGQTDMDAPLPQNHVRANKNAESPQPQRWQIWKFVIGVMTAITGTVVSSLLLGPFKDSLASEGLLDVIKRHFAEVVEFDDLRSPHVLKGLVTVCFLGGIIVPMFTFVDIMVMHRASNLRINTYIRTVLSGALLLYVIYSLLLSGIGELLVGNSPNASLANNSTIAQVVLPLNIAGSILVLLVGLATVVFIVMAGGGASNYFAGLMMYFIGITLMIPWRVDYNAFLVAVVLVAYVGGVTYEAWPDRLTLAAKSNFIFLTSGAALAISGSQILNELRGDTDGLSTTGLYAIAAIVITAVSFMVFRLSKANRDIDVVIVEIREPKSRLVIRNRSRYRVSLEYAQLVASNATVFEIRFADDDSVPTLDAGEEVEVGLAGRDKRGCPYWLHEERRDENEKVAGPSPKTFLNGRIIGVRIVVGTEKPYQ